MLEIGLVWVAARAWYIVYQAYKYAQEREATGIGAAAIETRISYSTPTVNAQGQGPVGVVQQC